MAKVLIYIQEDSLSPKGGPLGYNYNLKIELERIGCDDIKFLPARPKGKFEQFKQKLHKYVPKSIKKIIVGIQNAKAIRQLLSSRVSHKASVDISQFDRIHFHDTKSMYGVRDDLITYKGKVILTSHSPTLLSLEIYDMLSEWEKKRYGSLYKQLELMDEYSFKRANYIIFPCEDSEEPYRNNWPLFPKIKEEKKECFRYLLSGIQTVKCIKTREEILTHYNIPLDSIVISYVGRHNTIKGYDILKKMGEKILSIYPNVYFLIAGKEESIKKMENPRWIEVGWTNDPHSLISASDLFILPNRDTYFDLILLEVLSIGIPIVTSATGGNKYFVRFRQKGVFLYNTLDEAIMVIASLIKMSDNERKSLGDLNLRLFQEYFTNEIFARNYISLIKSLY